MKVDEWQDKPCEEEACENGCNCECPTFGFNLINYSIDDQMKLFDMSNSPSGYNEQPSIDDLLQPYEMRIKQLEEFIKKAIKESDLVYIHGDENCKIILPYWFMKDEIV